jgi:hypothetical protein
VRKTTKFHEGLTSTILAYRLLIVKPRSQEWHLFRTVHFAKARKLSMLIYACGDYA